MTSCFTPRLMAYFADGTSLPKRRDIGSKFNSTETARWNTLARNRGGETTTFNAPCGSCHPCRIRRAQAWTIRCIHEAGQHDVNTFVTLTYDDTHLPTGGNLNKRDVQLFLDRLRKHYRYHFGVNNIRYFGCGEYGGQTRRAHYHLILFGIDFADKQVAGARDDITFYRSDLLRDLWGNGHTDLSPASPGAMGYIAGYSAKALAGERTLEFELQLDHPTAEQLVDPQFMAQREVLIRAERSRKHRDNMVVSDLYSGELTDRIPEFLLCSRRPGIGHSWLDKYGADAFKGFVTHKGENYPLPTYYRNYVKRILEQGESPAKIIQYWKDQRIERLVESGPVPPEEQARLRAFYIETQVSKARNSGAPLL